ncbi:MAG: methyltransferase domain-containing protein [Acidobacteriota bacterium]|nr:methyltransferase domain-containing protein [Acidobacteriota bacterium]
MRDEIKATLGIYKWPSQAFWRSLEVRALQQIEYERPILEIGCGDGRLSALIFKEIDAGIDINPRSIDKCRRISGRLYAELRCGDARNLSALEPKYRTIYANCVLEHIPDIERVLVACWRGLRPGGKLVATVPLIQMNDHLLFSWRWYAEMRQQQLVHINLFTQEKWEAILRAAGFQRIEFRPYLSGAACRFWDSIDAPGALGIGRYRAAVVLGRTASKLLPPGVKDLGVNRMSRWLAQRAESHGESGPACAVVVIAYKAVEDGQ